MTDPSRIENYMLDVDYDAADVAMPDLTLEDEEAIVEYLDPDWKERFGQDVERAFEHFLTYSPEEVIETAWRWQQTKQLPSQQAADRFMRGIFRDSLKGVAESQDPKTWPALGQKQAD